MPTMSALDTMEALGVPRAALPRHIAIIMDGNGRWARQRGMPRIEGHRNASTAVRDVVTTCARLGLECVTLYSFSIENWKRPADEVGGLMSLYAEYLAKERPLILDNNMRLVQIGRRDGLPPAVVRELDLTENLSRNNRGTTLCLALNYGSRNEIVDAVQSLARRVAAGQLQPDQITEEVISQSLDTAGLCDPDLVIRTAGEMRLSNFLLWQISYAELYISPVLWPDFRAAHLLEAIRVFATRERRFGDIKPVQAATPSQSQTSP